MDVLANPLARQVGLKVGPVVLDTLVKHFFDRIKADNDTEGPRSLRRDELLYDEAFNIIKLFLDAASHHTVEEVQAFSNARTPSPPWVKVVRLLVPMSSCNQATEYLIKAFGGEEEARRAVGGVKWWQVRGLTGVEGQWIVAKKDWREAKRKGKMAEKPKEEKPADAKNDTGDGTENATYDKDMDEMRCILYAHGGGYYFGSIDQERYSVQRHARKIGGRVFAINYRLAPQYPFPCALQDLLAAYLFLIEPPPTASHRPVKPAHIVVAGDSAGGGLCIALLQVIRDAGLPSPAGGVLISPWCDLTHSFPSIHKNTTTDIIPQYGLSLQKPSTLWPPPSEEITSRVHASLRSRIRQTLRMDSDKTNDPVATVMSEHQLSAPLSPTLPINVGATAAPPSGLDNETIILDTDSGERLVVDSQVHMYCQNSQLTHPLISPVLSYLGGLPPLLVIASDKEVLRDEIIYAAHKAAHPDKYPLRDNVRAMYPALNGIEGRYGPTSVHLQVYDDAPHILPVLFSFTTPAKFCHRAIASFIKDVTGIQPTPQSPIASTFAEAGVSQEGPTLKKRLSLLASRRPTANRQISVETATSSVSITSTDSDPLSVPLPSSPTSPTRRASVRRSLSANFGNLARIRRHSLGPSNTLQPPNLEDIPASPATPHMPVGDTLSSQSSVDVAVPLFTESPTMPLSPQEQLAGDPWIYAEKDAKSWKASMIRERVSTQGVVRSLEPESELDAFQIPPEMVGLLSELAIRRYQMGTEAFKVKFAGAFKTVEKHRRQNLEKSKKDTIKHMASIKQSLKLDEKDEEGEASTTRGKKEGLLASSGSWNWAWALDGEERPPPSSIVSRRDTHEAIRLARIADMAVSQDESALSANNLWSVLSNFLMATPDRNSSVLKKSQPQPQSVAGQPVVAKTRTSPERKSRLATWLYWENTKKTESQPVLPTASAASS